MGAYPTLIRAGQLTINPSGVSAANLETNLRSPSLLLEDVMAFWQLPEFYGSNLRVPGADGTLPLERFRDEITISTGLTINGEVDYSGTPFTNPLYGLRVNRDRLLANVHGEIAGMAYRVAKLTLPYESLPAVALTVHAQCAIALGALRGTQQRAVFTIKIPAGGFG